MFITVFTESCDTAPSSSDGIFAAGFSACPCQYPPCHARLSATGCLLYVSPDQTPHVVRVPPFLAFKVRGNYMYRLLQQPLTQVAVPGSCAVQSVDGGSEYL